MGIGEARKRDNLVINGTSVTELNRVLKIIERRLDEIQGIGQNVDIHGARITNMRSGSGARQALATDGDLSGDVVSISGGVTSINLADEGGLTTGDDGLSVKTQAAISNPGAITAYGSFLLGGADTISLATANSRLGTLTTQLNAFYASYVSLLNALRAADLIDS